MQHEKARSAAITALLDSDIPTLAEWRNAHDSWRTKVIRKTVAALSPTEIWAYMADTDGWLDDFSTLVADTFERNEVHRLMAYGTLGHVFRHGIEPLAEEIIENVLNEGLEAAA